MQVGLFCAISFIGGNQAIVLYLGCWLNTLHNLRCASLKLFNILRKVVLHRDKFVLELGIAEKKFGEGLIQRVKPARIVWLTLHLFAPRYLAKAKAVEQ